LGKYDAAIKAVCKGIERIFKVYIGYKINSLSLNSGNFFVITGNENSVSVTASAQADGMVYSPQPDNISWSIAPAVASLSQTTGRTIKLTGTSAGTAVLTASLSTPDGIITSTASIEVKDKMHLFNDTNKPENWYVSVSNSPSLTVITGGGGAPSDALEYFAVEFKTTGSNSFIAYKFKSAANIKGYKKLCFWAKSSAANSRYSFKMQSGEDKTINLSEDWQYFELKLDSDVSSMISVFEVSPSFTSGIVFLDNIYMS
jgi:hypothetical protein